MENKMENKHIKRLILSVVFALFIIACGDNGVSTREYTIPIQTYTPSSSSTSYQTYIASSSSTSYWSLEIGYVCNGYNKDVSVNDKSKPVEGYIALNEICGNMANFTYVCEPIEQSVQHIMTFLNKETALQVVELAENYGAAFGFYNANDGYLRYIYFEQCYDGRALMKRQPGSQHEDIRL